MGLDGNPREAQARHTLRKMIPEKIRLTPNGNELWAEYALQPAAVLVSDQMVAGACYALSLRYSQRVRVK